MAATLTLIMVHVFGPHASVTSAAASVAYWLLLAAYVLLGSLVPVLLLLPSMVQYATSVVHTLSAVPRVRPNCVVATTALCMPLLDAYLVGVYGSTVYGVLTLVYKHVYFGLRL